MYEDYDDDRFDDGYGDGGFDDGYGYGGFDDGYGGFDDGYGGFDDGYGGFDDGEEEFNITPPNFQTEMGGFERANIQEDLWYTRMSKVPEIFENYKLSEGTLNLLKNNYKFKMSDYGSFVQGKLNTRETISKLQSTGSVIISNYVSYSKISTDPYFSNSEFINNLNPVALCLGHYIRNSDGSVNKAKLKEIKTLLKTKKYTAVTLGNIFRYLRIWNRTFKNNNESTKIE